MKILLPRLREFNDRRERQRSIFNWAQQAFGTDDPEEVGPDTRMQRFFEEAVELFQAHGLSKEQALKQVEITFARPAGDVSQEVGGVMITLQCYCESKNIDLTDAEYIEIERINAKPVEHFQKRQREKRAQGL